MRFLLFNLAVVAALFYLFNADRGGSEMVNDLREDPLQTIRQELASLAREIADGRESAEDAAPQSATTEMSKTRAQEPRARAVDPEPGAPASTSAKTAAQHMAPAVAQTLEADPQQSAAVADANAALPQVEDPAVARRRAEVLDGVLPGDDGRGKTQAEAGPPMSPEERLRLLYSLAEEMELLYVSKTTR